MTNTTQLSKRVASVQAAQHRQYLDWLTERIAENLGLTAEQVHRDAERLVQHWTEIGATTNEAKLAAVAVELEISPDELLERLRAGGMYGTTEPHADCQARGKAWQWLPDVSLVESDCGVR